MTQEEDLVCVDGDFITYSKVNHKGKLTNGVMKIKGDMESYGYTNFYATEEHTVKLCGNSLQNIKMASGARYFANLYITNSEGEVCIENNIEVTGKLKDTGKTVTGTGVITLSSIDNLVDGYYSGSMILSKESTLSEDITIGGTLKCAKNLTLNGYKLRAGSIQITAGLFDVQNGTVICSQDMEFSSSGIFAMQDSESSVTVKGNFAMSSSRNHSTYLTAGTLNLWGDFAQKGTKNFIAGEQHTTVLVGKRANYSTTYVQSISFADETNCTFGKLVLKKSLEQGYYFANEIDDICLVTREYVVDRTAPNRVENLAVTQENGTISLTWDLSDEDVVYYNIYRTEEEDAPLDRIATGCTDIYFNDNTVVAGMEYYYTVSAVDEAGNESEESVMVFGKAGADEESPVIRGYTPKDNSALGEKTTIEIVATDNARVKNISIECRREEDEYWNELISENVSDQIGHVKFDWDTSIEEEGNYQVRILAQDVSGLVSEPVIVNYKIDHTAPEAEELSLTEGNYRMQLDWEANDDVAKTKIYRKSVQDDEWTQIAETTETQYIDKNVSADISYIYKIYSIDAAGNETSSNIVSGTPGNVDEEKPQAIISEGYVAITGLKITLDGSMSTDNIGIEKYQWDLGNGDIKIGKSPSYTYEEAGEYVVTLQVFDKAGNSDKSSAKIIVYDAAQAGRVKIQLVDESRMPIADAYVYQYLDNGDMVRKTDVNGYVTIDGKAGTHKIAVFKNGYETIDTEIEIEPLSNEVHTIVMKEGSIAKTLVSTHKMSYQEIINSGIDLSNPDNYEVYRYEIKLVYEKREVPIIYEIVVNGSGETLKKEQLAFGNGTTQEKENRITGGGCSVVSSGNGEASNVFVITISGGVEWMKNFYAVDTYIQNAMSETFGMDIESELLTYDTDALTFMQGNNTNKTYEPAQSITSGGINQSTYYFRAEQSGECEFEYIVKGTISPIDETFEIVTKAQTTIETVTGEGIKLYVELDSAVEMGATTTVIVTAKNESKQIYNDVKMTVGKSTIMMDEFLPGEAKEFPITITMPQDIEKENAEEESEEEEKSYYYSLVEHLVDVLEGNDLGVEVIFRVTPIYIAKYKRVEIDIDNLYGDPVDLTTGALLENYQALSVTGASELAYDMQYISVLDGTGELGTGWSTPYGIRLNQTEQGNLKVQWKPGLESVYIKTTNGYVGIRTSEEKNIIKTLEDSVYTYQLEEAGGKKYCFYEDGRLGAVTEPSGKSITLKYTENVLEIIDDISGKKLFVSYKDNKVVQIHDSTGRITKLTYEGDLLRAMNL